jgi:hypothetical protein
VELMTTDQLTPQQTAENSVFLGDSRGLGRRRPHLRLVGPAEDMVGILMTQRLTDSPQPPGVVLDVSTSAYRAIDD